jgi:hypothetical protein
VSEVLRSVVTGVGGYLPAEIVTNADLAKVVDTSDEWIVERTANPRFPYRIRIEQDGRRLSFANDRGQVARGRVVERDVMFASDWEYGEKAHLGITVDGKFFRIKDAMAQFNMPEGQAWNFILWEGGTICFKSGP